MKMKVRHLAMASLLLAGTVSAEAQTIFSADFSPAQGYTDGLLIGQPAGAANQWVDANPSAVADEFVVQGQELSVISQFTGGNWVTIPIPVQSSTFTLTFEGQYEGNGTTGVNINICVSDSGNFNIDNDGGIPDFNEQGAMIRLAPAGIIDIRNGDWGGGGPIEAFEDFNFLDGERFFVRAEIDVAEEWISSVWARKEGDTEEVLLAEDFGFRRSTSAATGGLNILAIVENGSDGSAVGMTMNLDNIEIYGPQGSTQVANWSIH